MSKPMPHILEGDLYIGMSGIDLEFEHMALGEGLRLSKVAVHLLAPYMVVFNGELLAENKSSSKRDPDGTRWVNVTRETKVIPGHREYTITAELFIPKGACSNVGVEQRFLMQWIIALLRLWASPTASAPVIANKAFSAAYRDEGDETLIFPFETQTRGVLLEPKSGRSLNTDRISWVREFWKCGLKLVSEHKELHLAVQALDQAHFVYDWALGILLIWAALEGLFSPSRSELRFRTSALISSYLEPPGRQRRLLHNRLTKLYDARSVAAHERSSIDRKVFVESMELLRCVIIKMISESRVPSKDDLEASLFGG